MGWSVSKEYLAIRDQVSNSQRLRTLGQSPEPAVTVSVAGGKPVASTRWRRLLRRWKQWLVLLVALALSVVVFLFQDDVARLGGYGYLGAFLVAMLGASSVIFPVPNWIIIASLGAALNPVLVGLACAAGGTIGEMTGYGLGYGGRIAVESLPQYPRMMAWMKRRGSLTIFILALLPNPLFDAAGAAAGALRFPVWKFILFGGAGRVPKSLLYAYIGVWGPSLFNK